MPSRGARGIAERLSLTDRVVLREGLARVRSATHDERLEALDALVAAVRAGIDFPPPLAHDEDRFPFRRVEHQEPEHVAAALERLATSQPLVAGVALCHYSAEFRNAVWAALGGTTRATVRPTLLTVPSVAHGRTRRYAQELSALVGRSRNRVVLPG